MCSNMNTIPSGVARIWCEEGRETNIKEFKGDTQKYYEIHAIHRQTYRPGYFFLGMQPARQLLETNFKVCAALM